MPDPTRPPSAIARSIRQDAALVLTTDERETLGFLLDAAIPANTRLALISDARYLDAWWLACTGEPLPWPAAPEMVVRFMVHHLYDPEERRRNKAHGMPADVEARLIERRIKTRPGPLAPSTVERRLASWATLHRMKGLDNPLADDQVRTIKTRLLRASPHIPGRKSAQPVLGDTLTRLLAACAGDDLRAIRDRALLALMWASGGRRRSEVGAIQRQHIRVEADQPLEVGGGGGGGGGSGPLLPARTILLPRTKTTRAGDAARVWLIGHPVTLLDQWLSASGTRAGPVFLPITKDGRILRRDIGLGGAAVARIFKQRVAEAGLDPAMFSAHGLRSGFLTEAANQDVPIQQVMAQTLHKSIAVASRYYDESAAHRGRAARMYARKDAG
ncbi:integrase [Tistrella bauzanensis]|uniref:Integrase n=1 Tax=Tistrella bauzanensis TaxID=657419 RepID=A0ABQ1J8U9_9PROT|nr:tyrosine-type recombinase/integrase [Tistrella bauzanensis]GGB61353.1 integrase [Tistrella bauzanensis]